MKSYVFDVLKKLSILIYVLRFELQPIYFFCSPVCFHIVKCSKKLFLIIKISWAHFNGKLTISTVFLILKRKSILKATYTFNIDNTNIRKSFTNLNTTNCIFTYLKQYVVWYFYWTKPSLAPNSKWKKKKKWFYCCEMVDELFFRCSELDK